MLMLITGAIKPFLAAALSALRACDVINCKQLVLRTLAQPCSLAAALTQRFILPAKWTQRR